MKFSASCLIMIWNWKILTASQSSPMKGFACKSVQTGNKIFERMKFSFIIGFLSILVGHKTRLQKWLNLNNNGMQLQLFLLQVLNMCHTHLSLRMKLRFYLTTLLRFQLHKRFHIRRMLLFLRMKLCLKHSMPTKWWVKRVKMRGLFSKKCFTLGQKTITHFHSKNLLKRRKKKGDWKLKHQPVQVKCL